MAKLLIWTGAFLGSIIGSAIPLLWGASMLSTSAFLLSAAGAIAGVIAGYQFGQRL